MRQILENLTHVFTDGTKVPTMFEETTVRTQHSLEDPSSPRRGVSICPHITNNNVMGRKRDDPNCRKRPMTISNISKRGTLLNFQFSPKSSAKIDNIGRRYNHNENKFKQGCFHMTEGARRHSPWGSACCMFARMIVDSILQLLIKLLPRI